MRDTVENTVVVRDTVTNTVVVRDTITIIKEVPVEIQRTMRELSNTLFEFNKFNLGEKARGYLDEIVDWFVANPKVKANFPDNRPDCDFYAMVQPAKEVGGDLYDFLYVGDRLFFLVGDVSGKGVPAALFMSITRSAFRFIGALGLTMDEVVSRVYAMARRVPSVL